jgi:hypothetical protein
LIPATANIRTGVASCKTKTIMMMTMMIMTTITIIITSNTQTVHTPRFLQTLRLFYLVSFVKIVPRKLFKGPNFATGVVQQS